MKKIRIILACVTFAALLCAACGQQKEHNNLRAVKVNVVEVGGCGSYDAPAYEYVGTIEESSHSALSFGSGGRVTSVLVKEGQKVRKGQLLATIDNTTATNAHSAAQATLTRAQDGYDRAKLVYDKGSLPEVKWVEIQTQLAQAQSMAEIAKRNLGDCYLYAPDNGTIADLNLEVGSTVAVYQPVMRLLNLRELFAKVSIPEGDMAKVMVGSQVRVAVSALEGLELEGVVAERSVSADPLSHSYMVRVRLNQQHKELLPGMVCRVGIGRHEASNGFMLPNRAVQLGNDGHRYVWVVNDSVARAAEVAIGDLTDQGVFITEGLREGDKVIVDGALKVSNGTPVIF